MSECSKCITFIGLVHSLAIISWSPKSFTVHVSDVTRGSQSQSADDIKLLWTKGSTLGSQIGTYTSTRSLDLHQNWSIFIVPVSGFYLWCAKPHHDVYSVKTSSGWRTTWWCLTTATKCPSWALAPSPASIPANPWRPQRPCPWPWRLATDTLIVLIVTIMRAKLGKLWDMALKNWKFLGEYNLLSLGQLCCRVKKQVWTDLSYFSICWPMTL